MPRNSSGTMSLVSGNPVITNTKITSTWANTTFSDVANEITNSLDRNGRGRMAVPILQPDGTAPLPAFGFINDPDTGMYLPTVGTLGLAVGGTNVLSGTTAGLTTIATPVGDTTAQLATSKFVSDIVAPYANPIVNGSCNVAQAGPQVLAATSTFANGLGGCDNFRTIVGATTTVSATLQQGTASAGFASPFTHQVAVTSLIGTPGISCAVRIEAAIAKKFNGKSCVFVWSARQNITASAITTAQVFKANAPDNFSAVTAVTSTTIGSISTINTVTQRGCTVTFGANECDNGLELRMGFGALPNIGASLFEFGDLYFGVGTQAPTVVIPSNPADDFLRCARYYYVSSYGAPKGAAAGFHTGIAASTAVIMCPRSFPTVMRATPSLQIWNNNVQNQVRNTSTGATTAFVPGGPLINVMGLGAQGASPAVFTAGTGYDFDIIVDARI